MAEHINIDEKPLILIGNKTIRLLEESEYQKIINNNAYLMHKNRGKCVQFHRKRKKLSQMQLADECEADQSTISRIEANQIKKIKILDKLIEVLGEDFKRDVGLFDKNL